jgi:hypothetical protein
VEEVVKFLSSFENAYNHVYAFDLLIKQLNGSYEASTYRYSKSGVRSIRLIKRPSDVVLPEDQLRLSRIVIESPGFWDAIGAFSPLETIRHYLNDRHERRKDREYRESLEAERLQLEKDKLRTEIVKARVGLLRDVGVPEDRIRTALTHYVVIPLAELEKHQDSGLIDGAEVIDTEESGSDNTKRPPRP